MPATYEPIATTTLSSNASSITFSSIANSWTDLRLVLNGKNASGYLNNFFYIQFNSDSAGNYSETFLLSYGSGSAYTSYNTFYSYISLGGINGVDDVLPAMFTADIFSYASSTTYKTILTNSAVDRNGSGHTGVNVGMWRNTTPITSLTIGNSGGLYAAGTTATLYGIKAA